MPVENLPVYRHFLIHGIPKIVCALYEKVPVKPADSLQAHFIGVASAVRWSVGVYYVVWRREERDEGKTSSAVSRKRPSHLHGNFGRGDEDEEEVEKPTINNLRDGPKLD